ncbi:MAG: hypothetical protein KGD64_14625, partial [Candidatus Heimdallarchaeota archaeon]|nr:hypothetical protein [Candidatus Heimdallarchaeota archaeon]
GEDYGSYIKKCVTSMNILNSFSVERNYQALPTSIKEQVFLLYHYLGIVESIGNWTTNILILLLVASGKDFHIESTQTPRIRHVCSLDDLEKAYVPLTIKLNFLRYHDVKSYPSIIDSKLRNDIAHFNFKIEKNKVSIRGKPVWDVIYPSLEKISYATTVIIQMFTDLGNTLGW